jgi:uncharacterized protein YkwD
MRLRIFCAAALVLSLLAACGSLPGRRAASVTMRPVDVAAAASLVSRYRAQHGLGPVRADAELTAAASQQARSVASAGALDHGDFAGRMSRLKIDYAVENLSMGSGTLAGAIAQWKASAEHNKNMLAPQANRIGVARADSERPYWAMVLGR